MTRRLCVVLTPTGLMGDWLNLQDLAVFEVSLSIVGGSTRSTFPGIGGLVRFKLVDNQN